MAEVTTSAVLEAPAAAVWALLEDFGDIQRWWPGDGPIQMERVEREGSGIGMVRHIYNRGIPGFISERCDFLDPATRTWILSIIGTRPRGITAYVAEGHLVELDAGRCRIDYRANVTSEPGRDEQVRKGLLATWTMMFRGLEQAAQRLDQEQRAGG
jgi:carbon monoxide dehydrogenase subunit G